MTKERPSFLLKRKLFIIFSKDSERKEHALEKGSGRKSNWDDDLKNHIEEILCEDNDLEVNEIKERLVEKEYKLAYSTLCRYLNKIGFQNKNPINDLMKLTTAQKEKNLFGKNTKIILGIMLYSVMKLYFLILEKVERNV